MAIFIQLDYYYFYANFHAKKFRFYWWNENIYLSQVHALRYASESLIMLDS